MINRFIQINKFDNKYYRYFNKQENEFLEKLKKYGIKKYMENEIDKCTKILGVWKRATKFSKNKNKDETIHKQHQLLVIKILNIIIEEYPKLFQQVSCYDHKIHNNQPNYCKFFNQRDIVIHMFQFVGCYKDLNAFVLELIVFG